MMDDYVCFWDFGSVGVCDMFLVQLRNMRI